jgi:hypothetical protein
MCYNILTTLQQEVCGWDTTTRMTQAKRWRSSTRLKREWRELFGDRDWDYVYHDGEWEHWEDAYDEVLSEIGYYEGDFDW